MVKLFNSAPGFTLTCRAGSGKDQGNTMKAAMFKKRDNVMNQPPIKTFVPTRVRWTTVISLTKH